MAKFLLWIIVIIALIWLFENPAQAGDGIRQVVNDITTFAGNL